MKTYEYGCLYAKLPDPFWANILAYTKTVIQERDIIQYEDDPHITIGFGFTTNDADEVVEAVGEFDTVEVQIGKTSFFSTNEFNETDVVKIDVHGSGLYKLNERVMQGLNVVMARPNYYPHITLGFIKSGRGLEYLDTNPYIGQLMFLRELTYRAPNGTRTVIKAKGDI